MNILHHHITAAAVSLLRLFSTAWTLAVLAVLCVTGADAQTFAHYCGVANTSFDERGMQHTVEVEYYYYVDENLSAINLQLPCAGYTSNGSGIEPQRYFRWYDYSTDRASANLTAVGSKLKAVNDAEGYARGLFAINLDQDGNAKPCHNTIGVTYNPPADASDSSWQGETIACDVSRYNDWNGTGGETMTAEPTLSIRYIFHIYPARRIAEKIANAASSDLHNSASDLTLEDNKRIVVGIKNLGARIALRVNNRYDQYYFYPLKNTSHHVYAADKTKRITSEDFDKTKIYRSGCIYWRVYDQTKTKYTDLFSWSKSNIIPWFDVNTAVDNGNGWKTLDGNGTSKPSVTYGDILYVVAYARNDADKSKFAPVANFEVFFQSTYPKTDAQILAAGDKERQLSYIDQHYKQSMKPVSFDDDNTDMTLAAPTTPEDNLSKIPSRWDRRSYAFTYPQLKDFTSVDQNDCKPFTPMHGEYNLYKCANVKDISDEASGYTWCNRYRIMYDRTHALTGGKQYGHFLYIDASDESRQIAAADFKADLCSGAKLIFSGYVANFTSESESTSLADPEVLFRLYGVIRDENDKITDKRLIISFSSGEFNYNTDSRNMGEWTQVYAKLVLPRNSGAENYSDFRIVMDNMCKNTSGADYLIDDLRLYIDPAKADLIQNMPVCPSETSSADLPSHVTLKIRTAYESTLQMVGNKASHVFYRFCDEDGNAVTSIDYDGDRLPDEYGTAEVPAEYDETKKLPKAAAGGRTDVAMFEKDAQNEKYIVLADRNFSLSMSKKYYVSVAYPDADDETKPGAWGKQSNVCSCYSDLFELVRQNIVITDANGSVVTTVRVSCDENRTPDVNIHAKLETVDIVNGGKVTLDDVRFDWFLSEPDQPNDFEQIPKLKEALDAYRTAYPTATSLSSDFEATNAEQYALLKKYVDAGRLVIAYSNSLANYKFAHDRIGLYKVAAIPVAAIVNEGNTTYHICPEPMYFSLRIVEDGPKMTMGFGNVVYPNDERCVRIGLPQIKAMTAKGAKLTLPMTSLESSKSVEFNNESKIFISDTNDPSFTNDLQVVGKVVNEEVETDDSLIEICFDRSALTTFHEGYWYELNFSFSQIRQAGETVVSCPGETFIKFKIVPEYLTWYSSAANKLNANWNNDLNWMRSTAAVIYKKDYTDYGSASLEGGNADNRLTVQQAYVPMKFSKVTVTDQTGKVYPYLGNIVYRPSNDVARKLANTKGDEATTDIQYDMAVKWNYNTEDHSDTGDGNFSCENFKGNLCDEIYFKPEAELLDPCYLIYRKAYVEKEMEPNKWYIVSSPLRDTYAGDMYVPKADGRQQTEAFRPISFDETLYSRNAYPVYQRSWDKGGREVVDGVTFYEAADHDGVLTRIDTLSDNSMNVESLYWSHVYNRMDVPYADGKGFAIKIADDYTSSASSPLALLRLPKADTSYAYYAADGTESNVRTEVSKEEAYRLLVEPSNEEGTFSHIEQQLSANIHDRNAYHLLGNPYPATISAYLFLKANPSLTPKIWTLEAGRLEGHVIDLTLAYDRHNDVLITPMQAFFVKVKDGETAPAAAMFSTTMTVDRWISTSSKRVSQDGLTVTAMAEDGKAASVARVVINEDASERYDDTEDVELLNNSALSSLPQVYTVAGSEAVALNEVPGIEWLPIGVVAATSSRVWLSFRTDRTHRDCLWIFDTKTRSFTPVSEADSIAIEANDHGRYYITTASSLPSKDAVISEVKIFSPCAGKLTATAANSMISTLYIYSLNGQLVTSRHNIAASNATVDLHSGLYVVTAETESGSKATQKVIVK